jgi:hypothetical protein
MFRDGICRVTDKLYTKTVIFNDINYQLAQNEDKTAIFEAYCEFLNYFDASVSVQLTFINRHVNIEEFQQSIDIPDKDDEFASIRREYAEMLKDQLARGNNGLVKTKYITFGIEANSYKEAKPRLERIELDVLAGFKNIGVSAHPLDGLERLDVLHAQLHPDGLEKFRFKWSDIPSTGLSTKDYIAPSSFDFRSGRSFRVGQHHGSVGFLQILAPELTDKLLSEFLDLDTAVTVNIHLQSIDQTEAIKTVKRKLSDLDKMRIEEQKKAVRAGYDMEVLPPDLVTYGKEAQTLLNDLQSRNERMFLATILVTNVAKKKSNLDNDIFAAAGVAQKYNCALKRLDWQQEQGFMSTLALGLNQIEIKRGLTTSSTAIFVVIDLLGAKLFTPNKPSRQAIYGTFGQAALVGWTTAEKSFQKDFKNSSDLPPKFDQYIEGCGRSKEFDDCATPNYGRRVTNIVSVIKSVKAATAVRPRTLKIS